MGQIKKSHWKFPSSQLNLVALKLLYRPYFPRIFLFRHPLFKLKLSGGIIIILIIPVFENFNFLIPTSLIFIGVQWDIIIYTSFYAVTKRQICDMPLSWPTMTKLYDIISHTVSPILIQCHQNPWRMTGHINPLKSANQTRAKQSTTN